MLVGHQPELDLISIKILECIRYVRCYEADRREWIKPLPPVPSVPLIALEQQDRALRCARQRVADGVLDRVFSPRAKLAELDREVALGLSRGRVANDRSGGAPPASAREEGPGVRRLWALRREEADWILERVAGILERA